MGEREVLLSLAATSGPLPAAVATRLADGMEPLRLLRADSPEPAAVAARLDALGVRFMAAGDHGWPMEAAPPDPPCAWLFVAGPTPPGPAASVAVVGGRRASPLRRAAARALGAGLARAGWCVVSGGAVGVDAAAHAGALDAGGRTVVVLGCGLDVPYPRANTGLLARVRETGGTLVSEHPPGSRPRAAHFLPRNRLIAALATAVVVVEAAEESGSLSTARAAGSRGAGHVLVLPGAPWDPGAAGCNQLIRDGATLVRSLTDILEELGAHPVSGIPPSASAALRAAGGRPGAPDAQPRGAADTMPVPGTPSSAASALPGVAALPGAAGASSGVAGAPPGAADLLSAAASTAHDGDRATCVTSAVQPCSGLAAPARAVLAALVDGQVLAPARLAAATELPPADLDAALLDLELAGLVRRTAAGVQAIALPPGLAHGSGRQARVAEPRGPPRRCPPGVLECGRSSGDDGRDG